MSKAADLETEKIKQNKEKPEAKRKHKFKAAKWTHPNGHPRCIICGDEERVGGFCMPMEKSEASLNRRNPFNKTEDEIDLKKMSRGLPEFKNFPKVSNRPDQEIQNVNTKRQARIFSRKAATQSAFPQNSIKEDIADKAYAVSKPKSSEYTKAQQHAAKQRFNYDLSEEQATSRGAVLQGSSVKKPLGFVSGEANYPTTARREHEAIHLTMDELGKKYGHGISKHAEKRMNELIHPSVSEHLAKHLINVGYHKSTHDKELIPHLYEMLHDLKTRDIMRHTNPEFKQKEKEIMNQAKKSWKAIRDFAYKLKAGDEE